MDNTTPWYKDGLRFACRQCGRCCGGGPGYVWVTNDEIKEMAKELEISVAEFETAFVKRVNGKKKCLAERTNYDCVFLNETTRRCKLYKSRPVQCRTWPFWDGNLRSERVWRANTRRCPGCSQADGRLYSLEEIESQREQKF